MGNQIGEVNISLRMSLAQFKNDTRQGTEAAGRAAQDMAQEFKSGTGDARATLALLGEEIGVTIPRHIRGLIASVPGVGQVLTAAFSSVAVIALIEVLVKIVEKIAEFKKQAQEVAESMKKTGQLGADSLHKIEEQTIELEGQIDKLKADYLGALLVQLRLIDAQTLDQLADEFKKLETRLDETLAKMQRGWFLTMLGFGADLSDIKKSFDDFAEHIEDLKNKGDKAGVAQAIAAQLAHVQAQIAASSQYDDRANQQRVQALTAELSVLRTMNTEYEALNKKAKDQKDIAQLTFDKDAGARIEEEVSARTKLTERVQALLDATKALSGVEQTELEKQLTKLDELEQKWRELEAAAQAEHAGIKTFYGEELTALEKRKAVLEAEIAEQQKRVSEGLINGLGDKGLTSLLAIGNSKPTFTGDSASLELEKIKTNQAAAQAALTKVLDSVQDVNQKFKEQSAILDELHAKYPTVFDAKMLKKAKDAVDPIRQEWSALGVSIADSIKTGQLWGSSWKQQLQSIGIEILQLILKMTLLKNLQGGIPGGFSFSGLLNGLFGGGKADGGPLDPGKWYIAGEHGPEPIWGGGSGAFAAGYPSGNQKAPTVVHENNEFHFHGVQDADSFKKSQSQIAADMSAVLARHSRRNG